MSNGYWVSKDGLRIPKRDNAQRKQWDAGYLERLKDYFGDDKDFDYEPALIPVSEVETNHTVFESNPRIPFYSRLYRQNVHEVPPILVSQDASGRYSMRDGNHRHTAARQAGVSHIPALIQRSKKATKTKASTPHVFTGTKAKKLSSKPMKKSSVFGQQALMASAAFRHLPTGKVFDVGPWHDTTRLPGGLVEAPRGQEHFSPLEGPGGELTNYEAGFLDRSGRFHTRQQAAKLVGATNPDIGHAQLTGLESNIYRQGHEEGVYKSDITDFSKHEREAPPELPRRIARAVWALHQPGVLTDELRQPQYRSNPDPLAGHCFVATNALFHLIDGAKTGWEMKCIHKEHMKELADDTHWFLQHKKTGHVLDPTADQFEGIAPYERGVAKGTSQTGDDVGKPTKRAQVVIDRAKAVMNESPKEYLGTLEHDGSNWYIKPPEMKKAEEQRISLDDAHKLYDWFHISSQEPDEHGQFRVTPRIPKTAMEGEDTKTPRICVGPSIHHCVAGLLGAGSLWDSSLNLPEPGDLGHILADMVKRDPGAVHQFRGMHVYGVRKPKGLVSPTQKQVPDAHMTGEAWLTKPNVLEHVGRLTAERPIPTYGHHLTKAQPKLGLSTGVPVYRSKDGRHEEWSYSHLLPQKSRDEGYRIKLRLDHQYKSAQLFASKTVDGKTRPAGQLDARWYPDQGKSVVPWEVLVDEKDRRKRLGMAMYEALYSHARGYLGMTNVVGNVHSTASHLMHKKLATKHGLSYDSKPNIDKGASVGRGPKYWDREEWEQAERGDFDGRYAKYKYKLPDVLAPKPLNSFAEHKLPGSLHAEGYRFNVAHGPDTTIGTIHRRGEVVGHIELTPKGHAFEEWTGAGQRVGLRDAALSVLRGHQGGEAGHDEWNNVSKRLPVAKSASGSPNLLKHEDLHTLPGVQGQVGVRNPNGQGQGVPEVALQGVRGGGVGGVLRAQSREGGSASLPFQSQVVSRADGVPANAQGGNRGVASGAQALAEGADGRAEVGSVYGLRGHVPSVRDGLGPHGLLAKAGERGQHGGQAGQLGSDTGGGGEVRTGVRELPPGQDSHPTPHGSHITKPHLTYTHGAAAKPFGTEYEGGKNVWARNSPEESNKGR